MIIHKLLARHLRHRDDAVFYLMQATAAIEWIARHGGRVGPGAKILDLGCGHGVFGNELLKRACDVTFSDDHCAVNPEIKNTKFIEFNIDTDAISKVGKYDLVICSNVLEHLSKPDVFLKTAHEMLLPDGMLYLSWTNWLSLWGGHEFSPFHYLGTRRGHLIFDKVTGKQRKHTPYVNLYPTYIGSVMKLIRQDTQLKIQYVAPRYFTEFGFIMHIPLVREFLAWNCAMLLKSKPDSK